MSKYTSKIQDLLPLYVDEVVGEDTKSLVDAQKQWNRKKMVAHSPTSDFLGEDQ